MELEKKIGIDVVAKTDKAGKEIKKFKKDAEKGVNVPVNIDLSEINGSLNAIKNVALEMNKLFNKDVRFEGLQKGLDSVLDKINSVTKTFNKGKPNEFEAVKVTVLGFESLNETTKEIKNTINLLNDSKIELESFNKLEKILNSIESTVTSIGNKIKADIVRSPEQVENDLDNINKKLEERKAQAKEIKELEDYLNNNGIKRAKTLIGNGDSSDVAGVNKLLKSMERYIELGGDLSKFEFKIKGIEGIHSLVDALEILHDEGKTNFINSSKISGDVSEVHELWTELDNLNKELVEAKLQQNRKFDVSLDTKSIEEFASAIQEAVKAIGNLKFNIPEDFKFDGLSTENLDKIIVKLDEIVGTIKNIGTLLSTGVDTSDLHIKDLEVNVDPKVDTDDFIKKIEQQLESAIAKVKVDLNLLNKNENGDFEIINNEAITGIKSDFKNITDDFGFNLQTEISGIQENLKSVLNQIDYDNLFTSLRETLLDIVVQFQNSLQSVGLSSSQLDEAYKTIKGWNDADSYASNKANITTGERGAFLNSKTGTISNSFLADAEGSFRDVLFKALKDLSVGVDGEISSIYDTWVHSHPFRKAIEGLKAVGSDIGFSVSDLEIGIDKLLKDNLPNMLLTQNYKFSNLDLSGVSEDITQRFIEEYRKELLKAGLEEATVEGKKKVVFPSKLAKHDGVYDLDAKSDILNGAMRQALTNVGLDSSRLTTGNIDDLKVDLSNLQQEEKEVASETERLLSVLEKLDNVFGGLDGKLQLGISEESLNGIIGKLDEIARIIESLNDAKLNNAVASVETSFDNNEDKPKDVKVEPDVDANSFILEIENQLKESGKKVKVDVEPNGLNEFLKDEDVQKAATSWATSISNAVDLALQENTPFESLQQAANKVIEDTNDLKTKLNELLNQSPVIIDVDLNTSDFNFDYDNIKKQIEELATKDVVINIKGLLDNTIFGVPISGNDSKAKKEQDLKDLEYITDVVRHFDDFFDNFKFDGSKLFNNKYFEEDLKHLGFSIEKLAGALKNTGFADDKMNPTFFVPSSGAQHGLGAVGQNYVFIGRDSRQPATLESTRIKQGKIDELADMGVNIARIVLLKAQDAAYDADTRNFIEVQERKLGKGHREDGVHEAFSKLTSEQFVPLLRDMKEIFAKELAVEFCGDNILFDEKSGIATPIDILTSDQYPWMNVRDLDSFIHELSGYFEMYYDDYGLRGKLEEAQRIVENENFVRQPIKDNDDNSGFGINPLMDGFVNKIQTELDNLSPALIKVEPKIDEGNFVQHVQNEIDKAISGAGKLKNEIMHPFTGEIFETKGDILNTIPDFEKFSDLSANGYSFAIRDIIDQIMFGMNTLNKDQDTRDFYADCINESLDRIPELKQFIPKMDGSSIDDFNIHFDFVKQLQELSKNNGVSSGSIVYDFVNDLKREFRNADSSMNLPEIPVKPVIQDISLEDIQRTAVNWANTLSDAIELTLQSNSPFERLEQAARDVLQSTSNLQESLNKFLEPVVIDVDLNSTNFNWNYDDVKDKIEELAKKDVVINIKGLFEDVSFGIPISGDSSKPQREKDVKDLDYILNFVREVGQFFDSFKIEGSNLFNNDVFKKDIEDLGFSVDKLVNALINTGFADSDLNPTFSTASAGMMHDLGVVGEKYVVLGRGDDQPVNLNDAKIKQGKIDELADMGVNIARIVLLKAKEKAGSIDTYDYFEVQERKQGKNHRRVSDVVENMTKEQMVEFLRDAKAILDKGLAFETGGDNFLANEKDGLIPIDLATPNEGWWSLATTLEDLVHYLTSEFWNADFENRLYDAKYQVENEETVRKPGANKNGSIGDARVGVDPLMDGFVDKIQNHLDIADSVHVKIEPKLDGSNFVQQVQNSIDDIFKQKEFVNPLTGEVFDTKESFLDTFPDVESFANLDVDEYKKAISKIDYAIVDGMFNLDDLSSVKERINLILEKVPELKNFFPEIDDHTILDEDYFEDYSKSISWLNTAADDAGVSPEKFIYDYVDQIRQGFANFKQEIDIPKINIEPDVDMPNFVEKIKEQLKDISIDIDVKPSNGYSNEVLEIYDYDPTSNNYDNLYLDAFPEDQTVYNASQNEINSLDLLEQKIVSVTTTVDNKTRAFKEEEQVVDGAVQEEISNLKLLDDKLLEIINTIDELSKAFNDLNFNFSNDKELDNNLSNLLSDLDEKIKGLDVESLSKFASALKGLKVSGDFAENLEMIAIALNEFKTSISGISTEENSFLSYINTMLSKTDELANLAKILESTERKIKRAKDAIKDDSDKGVSSNDVIKDLQSLVTATHVESSRKMDAVNEKYGGIFGENIDFEKKVRSLKYVLSIIEDIKKTGSSTIGNIPQITGLTDEEFLNKHKETLNSFGYDVEFKDINGSLKGIVTASEDAIVSLDEVFSKYFKIEELFSDSDISTKSESKSESKDTSSKKKKEGESKEKVMSLKKAYQELKDTKEEYLALREKRDNNTATDAELNKLVELEKRIENAANVVVNKTVNDMNELEFSNTGEVFENAFDKAGQRIEELNSELKEGAIPLEKYNAEVNGILKALKGTKDNKIFDFIDVENLEEAKALMEEIIRKESDNKAEIFDGDFNDSKKITGTWTEEDGSIRKLTLSYDELSKALMRTSKAQPKVMKQHKKPSELFTQGWQNVKQYVMSFVGFYEIINAIRNGITVIRDLDTALTKMRKVSDESLSSLKKFQAESFDIASEVGTTAQQIQNSTADWMRLGETLEEAANSASVSNILLNVSEFESIDQATESLVAMSAAYDELDKIDIVDKLNNVGNNFSISTDGLATALQKSASALTTAGNDMDEAVALVTAGNAVVQDADSVGAGLRTIALRITGTEAAKAELEELGEDTSDFMVQTSAKSQQAIKDFTKVASNNFQGFDILDDNGNFKSTYEILLGISEIYEEIVATDKQYGSNMANGLLETLAGKNRANIAASILQNPDLLKSVYESSQDSEGSAQQELDKYLDSIEGKIQQFKNEVQEFWYNLISSDTIKWFVDAGTKIISVLSDIVSHLNEVGTLATVAIGALGIKSIGKSGGRVKMFTLEVINMPPNRLAERCASSGVHWSGNI